jgi:hypothetical protein
VGARVDVEALDPAAFNAAVQGGRYDAMLYAWHADPAPAASCSVGRAGRGGARVGEPLGLP